MVINYPSSYLVRTKDKVSIIKDFKEVKEFIDFDNSKEKN